MCSSRMLMSWPSAAWPVLAASSSALRTARRDGQTQSLWALRSYE